MKLDGDQLKLLEKITGDPLCTAHGNIINHLNELARDLIKLRLYLEQDSSWSSKLTSYYDNVQRIIIEIETISKINSKNKKGKRQVENEDETRTSSVVCPEKYLGPTFGYPFYTKGFETINCSSKAPIETLVTLIFDEAPVAVKTNEGEMIADQANYVDQLIKFVNSVYTNYPKVTSYLVLNKTNSLMHSLEHKIKRKEVKFVWLKNVTRGRAIQDVIDKVSTPFVLLANHLSHFTNHVDLERLVRVASSNNSTVAVGGSSRNLTGHWTNNCYRLQLKNYTLEYKQGYYQSFNECLVCDHLDGSFVAQTPILKAFKLDSSLDHGIYKDFFLRLKYQYDQFHNKNHHGYARHHANSTTKNTRNYHTVNNGEYRNTYHHRNTAKHSHRYYGDDGYRGNPMVVSCPDVMFHEQKFDVRDEDLLTFASRHSIRKIVESNGNVRWYGCKRDIKHRTGNELNKIT